MDAQKKRNTDNVLTLERILGKQINNIDLWQEWLPTQQLFFQTVASFTFLTRSFFRAVAHRFKIFWI